MLKGKTVLSRTYDVMNAVEYLKETKRVNYKKIESDLYSIVRVWVWGRSHHGISTMSGYDFEPIEYLREGVIIELLDNGVSIYVEKRVGTWGCFTLTGNAATQGNIEKTILMALEGVN